MTTTFKTIAGIVILAGVIGLTACDSSGKADTAASAPAGGTASTEPAPTAAPATVQPEASASPAAASPSTGGGSPTDAVKDSTKQLKELLQLAKQGKVPGVEYAAHSGMIDEVEAAWGEPDTKEFAGKGIYSTYNDKHVVFGSNKGSQIFDVRSSAADLQQLTLKEIEQTLGKPDNTTVNGSDKIYIYQAGGQYQLKFIIPDGSGTVDHISVFCEQDSINNMAG
ncbi:YjgB family protein [Paenibacillus pedocola]|uniref:YjgB family protein n=1 Tax=Paenibacillus pedocola TaxID=3242193 RepID=UPI0028775E3C|nr:YjgB family protein [Paenibacillus typhae]